MFSGCLIVRGSLDDPHQRARIGSVLAIIVALDVPLVVMATRWFRGMHPVAPEMEPSMRLVLLISVVAFTALFATLLVTRRNQLRLEATVDVLLQSEQVADTDANQYWHILTT